MLTLYSKYKRSREKEDGRKELCVKLLRSTGRNEQRESGRGKRGEKKGRTSKVGVALN